MKRLATLIDSTIALTRPGAGSVATGWRREHRGRAHVRIYPRSIRAGGRKFAVWVVIAEAKGEK